MTTLFPTSQRELDQPVANQPIPIPNSIAKLTLTPDLPVGSMGPSGGKVISSLSLSILLSRNIQPECKGN